MTRLSEVSFTAHMVLHLGLVLLAAPLLALGLARVAADRVPQHARDSHAGGARRAVRARRERVADRLQRPPLLGGQLHRARS